MDVLLSVSVRIADAPIGQLSKTIPTNGALKKFPILKRHAEMLRLSETLTSVKRVICQNYDA